MTVIKNDVRVIAFHLPQFHPIPENDAWWGKGFTEWTNTAKALPLFNGHYQPHVPADLGFYDLRLPEARLAQAELARTYGIEGFCYYHYWFAGKRLLERPVNDILKSGQPDFPFCLCWANETWTGIWHGAPNRVLMEQTYPGRDDWEAHFNVLVDFFMDKRYIRIDGRPVLLIYKPMKIPNISDAMDIWRSLAHKRGVGDLYIIGVSPFSGWVPHDFNLDASVSYRFPERFVSRKTPLRWLKRWLERKTGKPFIHNYEDVCETLFDSPVAKVVNYPCVVPNWDNTPRSGSNGIVFKNSTPELFRRQLKIAKQLITDNAADHKVIFVKSWNEWAEGNYLEPDLKFGRAYLEVLSEECRDAGI